MGSVESVRRRGLGLVIAGPSGVGKGAVTEALLGLEPDVVLSISVTTRAPRAGEVPGVHYDFQEHDGFESMRARGELLEWAEVFGERYGTKRAPVLHALQAGRDILFDIDWQGHQRLRTALSGDVVGVFLLPGSCSDLEARLAGRGDPPELIKRRMAGAAAEIVHWREFDYVVVNRDLANAVAAVRAILHAERLATARQTGLVEFVDHLR